MQRENTADADGRADEHPDCSPAAAAAPPASQLDPARLTATLNAIQEGVQVVGFDWRYLYVNDAVCKHGRRPREELLGRTMQECYPGIDETAMFRSLERCMKERQPLALENEFAFEDGTRAWFDLRIEPCPEGVFVLSVDVTQRKQFEYQLRQLEKMNAVGKLAGGVAHDFNNLLTGIKSFTTFALEATPPDHPNAADLQEVLDAADMAASLTHQLLAFSRSQPIRPQVVDVSALVVAMDRLLRRLLGADIDIVTRTGPDMWPTVIDPTAFHQVLVNLCVNARDAMPKGGRLTIETLNVTLDDAQVQRRGGTIPAGDYVVLAVSDDGTGMDAAVQNQIFDPFFTTKEAGKGTGLGLSTCHNIVKQAGGYIWLYSEPGHGTTFKVYLPRSQERTAAAPPAATATAAAGSETVLIVEDNGAVREVAVRSLARAGYDVHVAGDAEEALVTFEAHDGRVDLMVTDVILPGLNGRELARRVEVRWPHVRTLFMSGYTANAIVHRGVLAPGTDILVKPFTPGQLAQRVREVLDAPPVTPPGR